MKKKCINAPYFLQIISLILLMPLLLLCCEQAKAPPQVYPVTEDSSNREKLQIYGLMVKNITDSAAVISWITNQPTTSSLIYEAPVYSSQNRIEDTDLKTNHDIEVSNLFAESEYKVHIICTDGRENSVTIDEIFSTERPSKIGNEIGNYIPVFTLTTLDGKKISIKELRGKNVFLNFWNQPCPPCDKEMPYLQSFYDKYKSDNNIAFYTVAGISRSTAEDYVSNHKLTLPVMLDSNLDVRMSLNVRGSPTSMLIDKYGRLAKKHAGPFYSIEDVEDFASLNTK